MIGKKRGLSVRGAHSASHRWSESNSHVSGSRSPSSSQTRTGTHGPFARRRIWKYPSAGSSISTLRLLEFADLDREAINGVRKLCH